MGPSSAPVERVRQGSLSPAPLIAAVGALAVVVGGLLLPSAPGPGSGDRTGYGRETPVASRPVATDGEDDELRAILYRRQCQSGAGWRVVSMQRNGPVNSRTLWVANFAPTAAAAQRSETRLWTQEVSGIGFCPPGADISERLAHIPLATLWMESSDGRLHRIVGTTSIDPALAGVGEIYLGPPPGVAPGKVWPAGHYLVHVAPERGEPGTEFGWFALEVILISP